MALPDDIRERVREFARNLRLATRDARVEREQAGAGQPTVFYYDTDVVLRMIMGIELSSSVADERTELVRSLLACSMLGDIHMLRPHALELRNHLHQAGPSPSLEPLKQRAQHHLRARGVIDEMEALRAIVTGPEKEDGLTKAERFIRLFRAHSSATFVAIEQISGHWTQRLKRHYGSTLRFDRLGPEMHDLLDTDGELVQKIFLLLSKHRPDSRRVNLQDAAALAILGQMVRSWQQGNAPIVRFYSESPALWVAWRAEPELRALLSYPTELAGGDGAKAGAGANAVFRDASYFLARARFRELAPHQISAPLDKLERLLTEVDATEPMGHDEFQNAIEHIMLEGKALKDIIQEFEDLSLMRGIWRRIPPAFERSIEQWTDVFAFAAGRETGEALVQKISDIRGDLEVKLTHILRWNADRANLLRGMRDLRGKKITASMADPMRDLGLVRWGFDLDDAEKQAVIDIVEHVRQCDEDEIELECARLANRMAAARNGARECMVMSAVLWVMRLWKELDHLIEDCARAPNAVVPVGLRLIQAAARIRVERLDSRMTEELIARVSVLRSSVSPAQVGGYLLGLGYVLYHAWKQQRRGAKLFGVGPDEVPAHARAWAARCFEVGEEAAQRLRDADDLSWAYAVNHCSYVGLMTGIAPERTRSYLFELDEMQGRPAIWNARFDDTLGVDYLLRAEAALPALAETPAPAQRAALEEIVSDLLRARGYFLQASQRDFGDIDVDSHLNRANAALKQAKRALDELPRVQADGT